MNFNKIFIFPVVVLILLFTLYSCTVERKLAKEFLHDNDSIAVLVMLPDFIFKTDLNAPQKDNNLKSSGAKQDTLNDENRLIIDEVIDSLFLDIFKRSVVFELGRFGFEVFDQRGIADFFSTSGKAYQVSLSQAELEEGIFDYRAEEVFYDSMIYFEDFELKNISLNCWFEVSRLGEVHSVKHLLYASHYVMDQVDGAFIENVFTGEVKFRYNYFDIKESDVYMLAQVAGEKFAGYIFDYLLNEYIHQNFPAGGKPSVYFHYDRNDRTLLPAGDDRFIFMK